MEKIDRIFVGLLKNDHLPEVSLHTVKKVGLEERFFLVYKLLTRKFWVKNFGLAVFQPIIFGLTVNQTFFGLREPKNVWVPGLEPKCFGTIFWLIISQPDIFG